MGCRIALWVLQALTAIRDLVMTHARFIRARLATGQGGTGRPIPLSPPPIREKAVPNCHLPATIIRSPAATTQAISTLERNDRTLT